MSKVKSTKLQAAFLAFLEEATELGFDIDPMASIRCHPKYDSKHTVTNDIILTTGDYIEKRETVVLQTSKPRL
jgi:hypothetical protein|tara:strand:+ start:347 stop:565 length:219 start_codon:yes stop_codon:yes gene_type:complete